MRRQAPTGGHPRRRARLAPRGPGGFGRHRSGRGRRTPRCRSRSCFRRSGSSGLGGSDGRSRSAVSVVRFRAGPARHAQAARLGASRRGLEFAPAVPAPRRMQEPGLRLAPPELPLPGVWEIARTWHAKQAIAVVRALAPSAVSIRAHKLSAACRYSGLASIRFGEQPQRLDAAAAIGDESWRFFQGAARRPALRAVCVRRPTSAHRRPVGLCHSTRQRSL